MNKDDKSKSNIKKYALVFFLGIVTFFIISAILNAFGVTIPFIS